MANESTFTKLDTYLDNLVATTTSNRTTFQQLLDNNATLMASIASLTSSLAFLTSADTLLVATQHPNAMAPSSRQPIHLDLAGYCWTHGYRVTMGHSNATCTQQTDGHKATATCQNHMGDSTANRPHSS